jgi:HD-GYP domain-containing protein (c-di-GMP phosphodiesterase class II)
MRRITTKYAQLGMVLGMPVYDNYGKEIICRHTSLNDQCLEVMTRNHVSEIFIEDWRVNDLVVAPMVSPETEGKLTYIYHQFLKNTQATHDIDITDITQVKLAVNGIANDLTLSILGEINVSCFVSQSDYVFIQPVKSAILAMTLGQRLGMSLDQLVVLGMGALLKDISYCFFSPEITRETCLTDEKNPALSKHPIQSYNLLKQFSNVQGDTSNAILQHHEYWNGKGYPQGLKEQQISVFAQIIAIADAFSDLLIEQPGKQRYMSHEAIEYIMASSGDQFNPKLVEVFVKKIPTYPSGLTVKLNTGEIGIVSDSNLGFIARPIVRICFDPSRGNLKKPYDINLARSEFQAKLISKVLEYD